MIVPLPHRARHGALLAAAILSVAACTRDDASVTVPEHAPARVDSRGPEVKLPDGDVVLMVRTPTAAAGERGGTTLQLRAVLEKKNGKEKYKDKHITWTTTEAAVVAIDETGLATAIGLGEAFIVATYLADAGGISADSLSVDVVPVPVVSVSVVGVDSVSLDDTTTFVATPRDSAGEALVGRTIAWSSTNPGVARIDAGEVVAQAVGTTDIQATVETIVGSSSLRVWPQPVASVTVSPATVSVPQFHKAQFTATAYDRRGKILTGRSVAWTSSDPAIFYITANADTAAGKDVGTATVTATVENVAGTSSVTVTAPVEARALWVTRFEFSNATTVDFAKIATIMQKAASANFNVVYFQVRAAGDAYYFSDIEPCSPRMCGTLGGPAPARDPLDVALAEAAKYGIEVHAWVNAYTGSISGSAFICTNHFIDAQPANWLKAHPEWSVSTKNFTTGVITRQVDNCATTAEYMYVSPGVPEVRTQLARVSADLVRRYGPKGLKGIHLDRIRFPSNQVSYDPASQDAFRDATGNYPTSNASGAWLNFRRGFVNMGVREVYDSVRAVNPSFVLSAAVFPGYQPKTGWSAQWSYTDLFQDPQAWAQGGYLDVEVPMNYPATAASASWTVKAYCSNTDWTCVMDDHIQRIERNAGRHVYVGVGAIKGWTEVQKQLDLAHDRTATGMSVYSFSQVDAIPNGWALLAAGPFKHKATVPTMGWK